MDTRVVIKALEMQGSLGTVQAARYLRNRGLPVEVATQILGRTWVVGARRAPVDPVILWGDRFLQGMLLGAAVMLPFLI